MTSTTPTPQSDTSLMAELVERCITLCADVEPNISKLTEKNESFLAHSLEDTLQQLEVILRAFNQTQDTTSEERQGLFKRLFSRSENQETGKPETEFEMPDFDVTTQGLQGNALTVPLAELMGFLAFGSKTGVLFVDSPDENFLIGLSNGNLMHASSDRTPEGMRLGEVLVGLGYLTRRQLERFLAQHDRNTGDVSGELLLETGMISDEELQGALEHQVRQLFFRLVHTKNALFRFREGMQVTLAYQVNLPVNQLILESAQALDEEHGQDARDDFARQDWNSWRDELSSGLAPTKVETKESADTTNGTSAFTEESSENDEESNANGATAETGSHTNETESDDGSDDEEPKFGDFSGN